MNDCLVQAERLVKSYSGPPALQELNLSLPSGKIIGLLGPNASGKTTFIKLLAGLLTPTAGSITVAGLTPGPETKAIVSYLPERPYFNSWMRVSECLDFFCDFYADFDRALAERMLSDLGVATDAKLRTLSKGTKEKVQLVLVMARRARLYLLDEPIAGVDPAARDYILRTIISTYNKEASVILSTHLLADVESVLDQFVLLHNGRLLMYGNVAELREEKGMSLDEYFREVFRCGRSF
ncbi:MAG: ABC transporter ATP-binding protein [Clostridia bacterium]|nr:ABC transporter ATP-binding protein [Clostridia bacterium]MBQ8340300.1 ABC transporter ATP-binding protein [Clostridia bacterium]